jgi:signal transduction histidine kinase
MSLRLRLILLTVPVMILALALSGLYVANLVNNLATEAIERSDFASQQINAYITDHVNQHASEYPPPKTIEDTKVLWNLIAATDYHIAGALEKLMAASRTIIEINVAGRDGTVLVSSNPLRANTPITRLEPISVLAQGSLYQRLMNLASRRPDFEATIPIGIAGESHPVFTIQVVTSNVLLRENLLPRLEQIGLVSGAALLATLVLTVVTTTGALRPIRRIEQTIDRIVSGTYRRQNPGEASGAAKEFRVMEGKLDLLGEQLRGERQDASQLRHNVEQLLERVASDLDVATRFAAISRLTGGVAHEIKNPLNAIVLRLDLLRERLDAPEEELRKEIDILSKEAMRLDRVVKTFLDFSRPVEVNLRELDLAAVTREVTELLTPQAKLGGVAVKFEAPPEPALVRGDPDLLKQALLNLVSNGLEAMPDGGDLSVAIVPNGSRIRVEVSDTGCGIPPELRSKVFQLYFSTKSKGSGIGLAMTYRAVQLHNGTVEFTSEEGRGTTFRLEFPALVRNV